MRPQPGLVKHSLNSRCLCTVAAALPEYRFVKLRFHLGVIQGLRGGVLGKELVNAAALLVPEGLEFGEEIVFLECVNV